MNEVNQLDILIIEFNSSKFYLNYVMKYFNIEIVDIKNIRVIYKLQIIQPGIC